MFVLRAKLMPLRCYDSFFLFTTQSDFKLMQMYHLFLFAISISSYRLYLVNIIYDLSPD